MMGITTVCVALLFVLAGCGEHSSGPPPEPDASVVPAYIGGPCVENIDCPRNTDGLPGFTLCLGAAGGYCTLAGCMHPGFECPGASRCVASGPRDGLCVNPCGSDAPCRPGFECVDSMSVPGVTFCRAIYPDGGVHADGAADSGVDGG